MGDTLRKRGAFALASSALCILLVSGCGGEDDFENQPRPPVPRQLTGVITDNKVTISPSTLGAGPIVLTISNQTNNAHTLTLDGPEVEERVGPVNPLDTATIQKTLKPGNYEVRAGSSRAVAKEIAPGTLIVGRSRPSSRDTLLLP